MQDFLRHLFIQQSGDIRVNNKKMASYYNCLIANFSEDSITLSEWTPRRSIFYNRYIVIIVNILFFVIGTPFNVYVIISIFRKHLYNNPTMMLLLSLATADLLICIIVLPITIITGIADSYIFGDTDYVRCQVCQMGLLFHIFAFASIYTVALISIDRFLYIWRPLRYKKYMTVKIVRSLIVSAWLLSTAVSVTPLFGFGTLYFDRSALTCTLAFKGYSRLAKNTWYILFLALIEAIPIVTLIVTNVWVFCIALKSTKKHYKMMNQQKYVDDLLKRINQEKNKQELRLIKTFIGILVVNVITWIPALVILTSSTTYEPTESLYSMDAYVFKGSFTYLTVLSQSVVHPIIESRILFSFKKKMSNVFGRMCGKCCCCDENDKIRCRGKHCIFLDVCNAAFLPVAFEEPDTSSSNM